MIKGIILRFHVRFPSVYKHHYHWRIQGGHQGHAPSRSNFLHFHAVFDKISPNYSFRHKFRVGASIWETLNPPLITLDAVAHEGKANNFFANFIDAQKEAKLFFVKDFDVCRQSMCMLRTQLNVSSQFLQRLSLMLQFEYCVHNFELTIFTCRKKRHKHVVTLRKT